ncbi:unnamed protein product [Acanthoscelides obtectus]|uniref:Transmembrane protein n=1 Tax=Acanthoscelides obtectus TaxID=200917 RepID=A0A9P0KXP2_ACAOB|nr:unnamed protein product [Acanthoscelides obtectus]CAK1665441.1 hypothetical protein AOBTE_LOCUS24815 [Acanthoscelides obtectus]
MGAKLGKLGLYDCIGGHRFICLRLRLSDEKLLILFGLQKVVVFLAPSLSFIYIFRGCNHCWGNFWRII